MNNWYRQFQNIMENEIVPYDDNAPKVGDMTGAEKENMTDVEAKQYLESYPEGILKHDILENDSFVAINKYGIWVFWNSNDRELQTWDWNKDIEELDHYGKSDGYDVHNGWYYWTSDHFYDYDVNIKWWEDIRNGLTIPA